MWWCPSKQNQISKHGVFPLVFVWVREQGAWKLQPYNSIAKIHIFLLIKILPIWLSLKFCSHDVCVSITFNTTTTALVSKQLCHCH